MRSTWMQFQSLKRYALLDSVMIRQLTLNKFLKGNRASWVTREVLFQLGPRECHPALRKAVLRRELNSIATVLADALTLGGLGCCHSSDWDNTDRGIGMYYQVSISGLVWRLDS